MAQDLQAPGTDDAPNWASLYRARGSEQVVVERPILTGDIFVGVPVLDDDKPCDLAILQHPCSIRRGTALTTRVLCAEVIPGAILKPSKWNGSFKIMPLPGLRPDQSPANYEVRFDRFHVTESQRLLGAERVACLDLVGIDLFLQRWVHHNARVVVPTSHYFDATIGQYAEADIIEEWCIERQTGDVAATSDEADGWLGADDTPDISRRDRLKDAEHRARIQREARIEVKRLNAEGQDS